MTLSYTTPDRHNTLGFTLSGATVSIPGPPLPQNAVPFTARSGDPKTAGAYYVEFPIIDIGTNGTPNPAFGIAMLGALITGFWNAAGLAALYYGQGDIWVNGSHVRPGGVFPHTNADTTTNLMSFADTTGILVGDTARAGGIPANTSVVSVGPTTVVLDASVTGTIPSGTGISFARKPLATGDTVAVAVDLGGKTIAFRRYPGYAGEGWTPNYDISSLNIAGGIVLAVTDSAFNNRFSATMRADPGLSGYPNTVPGGFTPGWPVNEFDTDLGVVKLTAFAHVAPPNLAVRKLDSAALLGPPNLAVRKLTAYMFFRPKFSPPADVNRARVTIIG